MAADQCPACAAPVAATDLLRGVRPRPARPTPRRPRPPLPVAGRRCLVSVGRARRRHCPGCGGAAFGPEGYCDGCGQRRPAGTGPQRAGAGQPGRRHRQGPPPPPQRGRGRRWAAPPATLVAVVCDGVSSSTRPDAASNGAVDAALAALMARAGRRRRRPARRSARRPGPAQAAAALAAGPEPGAQPARPRRSSARSSSRDAVTVGWVGDSRAYWVPDADGGGPACLTVDDSIAGQFAAPGRGRAGRHPDVAGGGAGALVGGRRHRHRAPPLHVLADPGRAGSWSAATACSATGPAPPTWPRRRRPDRPLATAQALVRLALDAGGAGQHRGRRAALPTKESPDRTRLPAEDQKTDERLQE